MALDDLDALAPTEQRARAMQLIDQALPCTAIEHAMIAGSDVVVGIQVNSRGRADVTNLAVLGLVFGDADVETGWLAFAPPTPSEVAVLLLRVSIAKPTPCDFTVSFRFQQGAAASALDPSGLALLVRAQRLSLRFDDSGTLDQAVIDAPTDSSTLTSLASSLGDRAMSRRPARYAAIGALVVAYVVCACVATIALLVLVNSGQPLSTQKTAQSVAGVTGGIIGTLALVFLAARLFRWPCRCPVAVLAVGMLPVAAWATYAALMITAVLVDPLVGDEPGSTVTTTAVTTGDDSSSRVEQCVTFNERQNIPQFRDPSDELRREVRRVLRERCSALENSGSLPSEGTRDIYVSCQRATTDAPSCEPG